MGKVVVCVVIKRASSPITIWWVKKVVFVKFSPFGYKRASSLKLGWQKRKKVQLFLDYPMIGRIHAIFSLS